MYLMSVFTLLSTAKQKSFILNSAIQERLQFILELEAVKIGMEFIPSLAETCTDVPLIGSSLIVRKCRFRNITNIFPFFSACFSDYV
jgi:hypothetical protein